MNVVAADDALAEILAEADGQRESVFDDVEWIMRLSRLFVTSMSRGNFAQAVSVASQLSTVARNASIRLELAAALERGAVAVAHASDRPVTKTVVRVGRGIKKRAA